MNKKGSVTQAGFQVKPVYHRSDVGPEEALGEPGEFPFTRGIYPGMYRSRHWTMRQYSGFGSAEATNKRFKFLIAQGQTGLSVAFDLPTQLGYDSDSPKAAGEVGRVGVPISSVENMQLLFQGINLGSVSTSMTINATAAIMFAMYAVAGEAQGIKPSQLRNNPERYPQGVRREKHVHFPSRTVP